jgi:hypothetical protein
MATILEYFGIPPSTAVETENRYRYLAVLGQTTFSATYSVGYVDVFYNGSSLDPALDFTATDGSHIILSVPCVGGETIDIVSKRQVQNTDIYSKEEVNSLLSNYYGIATGTGDAMSVITSPTFSSFLDGMEIKLRTVAANTTTIPAISFNSLSSLPVVRSDDSPLAGNDWGPNTEITVRYIQLLNKFVLIAGSLSTETPPQFSNNNSVATTGWTSALGVKPSAVLSFSSAINLTLSQVGSLIALGGTVPYVVTLPTVASVPATYGYILTNVSSIDITVACQAGNSTDSGSTVVLTPGARYCVVSDGNSTWRELFWSNQVDPNFTAPTTVTPSLGDNSTRIPTTAFIQESGLHYNLNSSVITATTVSMSATSIGGNFILSSASVQNVTLPDSTSLLVGSTISFSKETVGASAAVITTFGGVSTIDSGNGNVSSLSLAVGEDVTFTWTGSLWGVSGSNLFRRLAFPVVLGASGAASFPGGIIRQWGTFSLTTGTSATNGVYTGSAAITLPIGYQSNVTDISINIIDASGAGQQFSHWTSSVAVGAFTINASCATASRLISGTWSTWGF